MVRKRISKPTDAELEILRVLWKRGPSTVRDVHAELKRAPDVGYTTVLKLMQIMAEKGLVQRDRSQRTHLYVAAVGEADTQRQLVGELMDKAFGGSASQLVMRALSAKAASPQEIAEIQELLRKMEGRQ